jgi:hypothetical protein
MPGRGRKIGLVTTPGDEQHELLGLVMTLLSTIRMVPGVQRGVGFPRNFLYFACERNIDTTLKRWMTKTLVKG